MNVFFQRMYLVLIALFSGFKTRVDGLEETLLGKASTTALNTLSGTADNLSQTVDGKASTTALNDLSGAVNNLSQTVDGKASTSSLNSLSGTVDGLSQSKADASALNTLSGTVDGLSQSKADASAVNTLSGTVDSLSQSKADVSLLTNVVYASDLNQAISQLQGNIGDEKVLYLDINAQNKEEAYALDGISLANFLGDSGVSDGKYEINIIVQNDRTTRNYDVVEFIGTPYESKKVGTLDRIHVNFSGSTATILGFGNSQVEARVVAIENGFGDFRDALVGSGIFDNGTISALNAISL